MISIQDILDADIGLYNPIIKVWDEKEQEYVDVVAMFGGDNWKKYRNLPIKYMYTTLVRNFGKTKARVVFEVSINEDDE